MIQPKCVCIPLSTSDIALITAFVVYPAIALTLREKKSAADAITWMRFQ